jgi:heme A synthase
MAFRLRRERRAPYVQAPPFRTGTSLTTVVLLAGWWKPTRATTVETDHKVPERKEASHMKALEAGTTLASVLAAASVILILAVLAVGGVVAGVPGYHCW